MAELRTSSRVFGGIETRVYESGPERGNEAVVFLHGSPTDATVWAPLQQVAGEFARTVAFDLPGYGEALDDGDFPHDVTAYAEFIGAALDGLEIERAHLVMNDIGGSGLVWAVAHPDRLASTTQIATGIINQQKHWHPVGRLFRLPFIGGIAERVGHMAVGLIFAYYDVLSAADRRRIRDGFGPRSRRALHRMYRATPISVGRPLIPALRVLGRPALVVWGGRDRFVPVADADQRVALPQARVEILENSGHYPHLDDPDGVIGIVVPFLKAALPAYS